MSAREAGSGSFAACAGRSVTSSRSAEYDESHPRPGDIGTRVSNRELHNDDKLKRLSILSAMDRSIDRAREQRENFVTNPRPATEGAKCRNEHEMIGEPLPTSMFDHSGPMLKARPKRTHSD